LLKAGFEQYLDQLKFNLVGYGDYVALGTADHYQKRWRGDRENNMVAVAVLGNRISKGASSAGNVRLSASPPWCGVRSFVKNGSRFDD